MFTFSSNGKAPWGRSRALSGVIFMSRGNLINPWVEGKLYIFHLAGCYNAYYNDPFTMWLFPCKGLKGPYGQLIKSHYIPIVIVVVPDLKKEIPRHREVTQLATDYMSQYYNPAVVSSLALGKAVPLGAITHGSISNIDWWSNTKFCQVTQIQQARMFKVLGVQQDTT